MKTNTIPLQMTLPFIFPQIRINSIYLHLQKNNKRPIIKQLLEYKDTQVTLLGQVEGQDLALHLVHVLDLGPGREPFDEVFEQKDFF